MLDMGPGTRGKWGQLGGGGEGGPGPPEGGKDKQSMLSKEGGNMEKEED
jgi:hypothetical protein